MDGARERVRERRVARESLASIRTDPVPPIEPATELAAYTAGLPQATGVVYRALAADGPVERRTQTWQPLSAPFGRRTVRVPRADEVRTGAAALIDRIDAGPGAPDEG